MVVKWEGLGIGGINVGKEVACPNYPDKSVQVIGTFGGASVTLQGSNMPSSPTTWATLTDPAGSDVTLSAAGLKQIMENTYWVRPVVTSLGATTDVDVYLLLTTVKG